MRLATLSLLLAAAALSLPALAASPSFNCAKATHEAEKMICKDGELADLDRSLSQLYRIVLENSSPRAQEALKSDQRIWVNARNDCRKADDMRGCIADEYRTRIGELKDR